MTVYTTVRIIFVGLVLLAESGNREVAIMVEADHHYPAVLVAEGSCHQGCDSASSGDWAWLDPKYVQLVWDLRDARSTIEVWPAMGADRKATQGHTHVQPPRSQSAVADVGWLPSLCSDDVCKSQSLRKLREDCPGWNCAEAWAWMTIPAGQVESCHMIHSFLTSLVPPPIEEACRDLRDQTRRNLSDWLLIGQQTRDGQPVEQGHFGNVIMTEFQVNIKDPRGLKLARLLEDNSREEAFLRPSGGQLTILIVNEGRRDLKFIDKFAAYQTILTRAGTQTPSSFPSMPRSGSEDSVDCKYSVDGHFDLYDKLLADDGLKADKFSICLSPVENWQWGQVGECESYLVCLQSLARWRTPIVEDAWEQDTLREIYSLPHSAGVCDVGSYP